MTELQSLPDIVLSTIFIYASNPALALTCRTLYIVACSTSTRAQWLMHRYKYTVRAAYRGVHWRFFTCEVLRWLDSRFVKETNALRRAQLLEGEIITRSLKRAKLQLDTDVHMNLPLRSDGVGAFTMQQSDQFCEMISFQGQDIPCWLFSNRIDALGQHASPGSVTKPQTLILAQELLLRGASPNTAKGYPLVKSASLGRLTAIRQLLDAGADIAANGNRALFEAAKAGHIQVVEELVRRGAEPDTKALRVAVESGHWKAVDILVAYGAEPDINVLNAL